ncbi:MAG TPA: MBL fold metallo-hydrolase [Dehalococcoidia bacterium]|nr:MBL fold metallo-hydrolase [Dehalococcoidia bacterium]
MKVTFLGTGAAANPDREQCAIVVQADEALLFDVTSGTGILRQLAAANVDLSTIRHVFLSHAHFDHAGGLPPLFLALMDSSSPGLTVHGAPETIDAVRCSIYDELPGVEQWMGSLLTWDKMDSGQTFEVGGKTRVEAVAVDHTVPCLAYVVRDNGSAAVVSGDTRFTENLIKAAEGTDLLIHEAAASAQMADWLQLTGHSSPRDAAITARDAGVKQLILTHIDREGKYAEIGVLGEAAEVYGGQLRMAHDLMAITVNGR